MRILHCGDLHIGMKFSRYPNEIRDRLVKARIEVLEKLIDYANHANCNIFAIAGDLFENKKVTKGLLAETILVLNRFAGECVLVLPGNHDYDDGISDLWKRFKIDIGDNVLLLNQKKVYPLQDYGLNVNIYPAYCDQIHSAANNLGWISAGGEIDPELINIGIAHGAFEGTSADLVGNYFYMSRRELDSLNLDLWMLGHCHVRLPDTDSVSGQKIFNCGTPEPDGMNHNHAGNAWLIDIAPDKSITAQSIETGQFRFFDLEAEITSEYDLLRLHDSLLCDNAGNKLVRLNLSGSLDDELFASRQQYYNQWEKALFYLDYDDSELRRKASRESIEREFTQGSFPYRFLNKLADDDETLQIAYELIRQVR